MTARMLADLLSGACAPGSVADADWAGILSIARAEALHGTLAEQLADEEDVPPGVAELLRGTAAAMRTATTAALWEAEMARRALDAAGVRFVLLKGTAYAAAALPPARGRQIGDLDILVARDDLPGAEAAVLGFGWEWVKQDAYDDAYYRQWMHELPPMIHGSRDRMIDVHHSILPMTHRARPDAAALLADAVEVAAGQLVLSREDMICHAAAHLIADGDLAGGMRNAWDIHGLFKDFGVDDAFVLRLIERARRHGLERAVARALRLAGALYGTRATAAFGGGDWFDALILRRVLARDSWGRERRRALRFGFYLRGHAMRMPPAMLVRHLWTKARR